MNMNAFANQVFGMPPAKIITAGQHKTPNAQIDKADLKGLFEYEYSFEKLTLQCFCEYEASEKATRDEPGWPESITLIHALVNGVDVACLLDEDTVAEIEAEAGGSMESAADDDLYDRGEELYNSRRAA